MRSTRAAGRYARAILDVAESTKTVDEVSRDFDLIDGLIRDVREFSIFLRSPVVSTVKKKKVLTETLKGRTGALTFTFILLLATKGREGALGEIIRQFVRLRDERRGILSVTARTAVKFTGEQERDLDGRIERATGKKAAVRYVIDPALRGGFTVQHEDTVWDASVRHQLDLLRKKFTERAA